ncbi:unnamed protein product [Cuscuta epithymum]|uniref:Protein kinase domain-containing protein n=1 Tax=Cuscuta epithymum TaxID=186058 RepID=A0AAV0ET48_9ASTE|nr:unnamed protein product [Cuscuta epithymum]
MVMAMDLDLKRMDEQLKPHVDRLLNILEKGGPAGRGKTRLFPTEDLLFGMECGKLLKEKGRLKSNPKSGGGRGNPLFGSAEKGCQQRSTELIKEDAGERHPPLPEEGWQLDPKKLTIKALIDEGASGFIYRGSYNSLDVAVKVFEWEDVNTRQKVEKDFLQEVSVWYHLDHPNVAKFIGGIRSLSKVNIMPKHTFRVPKNGYCLVVEYLAGGSLREHLSRHRTKKLSERDIVHFAIDIAKGLCYLHSKKIIHRDVMTRNLLLDKEGRVKFVDFGVSRLEAANKNLMTASAGTQGYMAPEVFDGEEYDHKCDIYSFGICLWEIYTCTFIVDQGRKLDIPDSCPKSLADLMTLCLDSDSSKRPEMEMVVKMLEAIPTQDTSRKLHYTKSVGCFSIFSSLQKHPHS